MCGDPEIDKLACAMASGSSDANSMDAGYTYFGQFIAHEIVPVTHTTGPQRRDVRPYIELNSVYGDVGKSSSWLNEDGCFPIDLKGDGFPRDIPRHANDVAHIPEERNDENVIVSQLHLFWQRLHNLVIKKYTNGDADKARRYVTIVFQLIVVEDYLKQVLNEKVYKSYFCSHKSWLNFDPHSIPKEFSHAAFRFGHSMVRERYKSFLVDPQLDIQTGELFRGNKRLEARHEIDWKGFFGAPINGSNGAQGAKRIDPLLTPAMASATAPDRGQTQTVNVIRMNILSGVEANLPTGMAYANAVLSTANFLGAEFELKVVTELWTEFSVRLVGAGSSLTITNLPLWPYLLNEAIITARGRTLGILGSLICGEVIYNAIRGATPSVYEISANTLDIQKVLGELGDFGKDLQSILTNERAHEGNRKFCMHHLLKLDLNH